MTFGDLNMYIWITLALLISATLLFTAHSYVAVPKGKLPPGPRGLPIVGNLHQLTEKLWLTFHEWTKQYGPIFYLNIAGHHMVVLGSNNVSSDLLDRRAAIYSGRPRSIVAFELLTGGLLFAFIPDNDVWKRMRRASHEAINNRAAKDYFPSQEAESLLLVDGLITKPELWDSHLRRASTSLTLSIIYGLPPTLDAADPITLKINQFAERVLAASAPGAHLVDYFTWMEHLPRWMCRWRRHAEDWFKHDSIMFEDLFADVRTRSKDGNQRSSIAATLTQEQERKNLDNKEATWVSATLYAAGTEAISVQLAWFLMAMVLYPDVQKKAQEEIDRVIDRDRMPTLQDYDRLPYIRAIVKETLRWRSGAPFGVPHRLAQDDWYEGYFLPKGTICVANIWGLNHDTEVYGSDVDDFRPERFLDAYGKLKPMLAGTKDEGHVAYGFGRRICVGRHIANNSLFIEIASILWACSIHPGKNAEGNVVKPDPEDVVDEGLVIRPVPFPCDITPRTPEVEAILVETKDRYGLPA